MTAEKDDGKGGPAPGNKAAGMLRSPRRGAAWLRRAAAFLSRPGAKLSLGVAGPALLFVGIFAPAAALPDASGEAVHRVSFIGALGGAGWVLLLAVAVSAVLVMRRRYGGLWVTGVIALVTVFASLAGEIGSLWTLSGELRLAASPLADSVGLGWGWLLLIAGAVATVAPAAAQVRSWRREDTGGALGAAAVIFFVFALGYPMLYVFEEAFRVPAPVRLVEKGESLDEFATRHGVPADALRRLNGLAPGREPEPGAVLRLGRDRPGIRNFLRLLFDPASRGWIANSLALGIVVTLMTFLLALPLAFFSARREFPGKGILTALILVPMVLPPFVGAIGMKRMLSRFGSINLILMGLGITDGPVNFLGAGRFWGVALLEALHLFPIMYLNLTAAMANVDPALEEAAASLGDSGLSRFRRVTLPLMLPGIFGGSAIVFVWAFTDLGTPLIMQYQDVVSKRIFDKVSSNEVDPAGFALVVTVLLITAALFALGRHLARRRPVESETKGATRAAPVEAAVWERRLAYALFGGLTAVALLPHLGVVLQAFSGKWFMTVLPTELTVKNLTGALTHDVAAVSVRNSLLLSLGSTAVNLALGVALAAYIVRSRSRLAGAVDAMVMLPLAIPGIVLAFGYVGAYSGGPSWLSPRGNPMILLVVSYSVRRLPLVVRACVAGFQQTPRVLEEASLSLGATPRETMRRVTLPLISAQLVAGGILAFSFAMLAVSDSLILALRERFYPLTKGIYTLASRPGDGPGVACALGLFGMVLLAGALFAASKLLGKRLGSIFRA